jgi:hypothetical protein
MNNVRKYIKIKLLELLLKYYQTTIVLFQKSSIYFIVKRMIGDIVILLDGMWVFIWLDNLSI